MTRLGAVLDRLGVVLRRLGNVLQAPGRERMNLHGFLQRVRGVSPWARHGRAGILGPPNTQKLNTEKPNTEH